MQWLIKDFEKVDGTGARELGLQWVQRQRTWRRVNGEEIY